MSKWLELGLLLPAWVGRRACALQGYHSVARLIAVCLFYVMCDAFAAHASGASGLGLRTVARAESAGTRDVADRGCLRERGGHRGALTSLDFGPSLHRRTFGQIETIAETPVNADRSVSVSTEGRYPLLIKALAPAESCSDLAAPAVTAAVPNEAPPALSVTTPAPDASSSQDGLPSEVSAGDTGYEAHDSDAKSETTLRLAQLDRELARLSHEREAVTLVAPLTLFAVGAAGSSLFSTLGIVLVSIDCGALGDAENCVRSAPYGYASLGLAGAFSLMSAAGLVWTIVRAAQRSDIDSRIRERRNERSRIGGVADLALVPLPINRGAAFGLRARF